MTKPCSFAPFIAAVLLAICCQLATADPPPSLAAAFDMLSNDDIDWREMGFGHAGPKIIGTGADRIFEEGVGISERLIPKLDDPKAYMAAHVLLTELWRKPLKDKPIDSKAVSTGYTINYNGLNVTLEWSKVADKFVKSVSVANPELQQERIRNFWLDRLREHPTEFSPKTAVWD
jgi:hypothetical protein